jgi:hypothetical protein
VAKKIADVNRETAKLNAQAGGDRRLEQELEIQSTLAGEVDQLADMEHFYRKFPGLLAAIQAKAAAARQAVAKGFEREAGRFADELREAELMTAAGHRGPRAEAEAGALQTAAERQRALKLLTMSPEDRAAMGAQINAQLKADFALIEIETIKPLADQLGRSFAGAIADGISAAVATGDVGKALRSITGSMIMAIGDMMIQVGTQALLATELITRVMATSGTPLGLGAALALIAAGGVVHGLGQALASAGGGRSSAGGPAFATSGGTIINRGIINPVSGLGTNAGSIQAGAIVLLQPTIFGTRDADAQRGFLEMYDLAMARR